MKQLTSKALTFFYGEDADKHTAKDALLLISGTVIFVPVIFGLATLVALF